MRIARLGPLHEERPAVIINDEEAVFVDDLIADWNRANLENGGLERVKNSNLHERKPVKLSDYRIGSPVAVPTKVICIGLNYAQHAIETGATPPDEPVIFFKAPDTVIGGFDDIVIPPNSTTTDYEVELSVVIGKKALYLESPESAREYILGYTVAQDVSERHWQVERSGQWSKGKCFPTFNPLGPWLVTADELTPNDLRLSCTVSGEVRQNSRTSDFIFPVDYCIWYLSQFMELHPGDIINTGTPEGVGMGFKPPKYLTHGEIVESTIEGIGTIRSVTR